MSSGSTASLPILTALHALIAGHLDGHDAVCGAALHGGVGKLFLRLHHLGLHLLDLLHQLRLVHVVLLDPFVGVAEKLVGAVFFIRGRRFCRRLRRWTRGAGFEAHLQR